MPDDWKTGDVNGLRAYGGFEVSFSWDNGQVQKIVIKSDLGGNCRIRVPNEVVLIDGTLLNPASGVNPNPFFATAQIKDPLISNSIKLHPVNLKPTFLYDLPTQAGETYTIIYMNDAMRPKEFALWQNYPNPFNQDTRIDYILKSDGHVALRIYDILGREVATLVDAPQIAGTHWVKWNGRLANGTPMASGIYIVSLTWKRDGESLTLNRKMVLSR
jgi:hypothetical protein